MRRYATLALFSLPRMHIHVLSLRKRSLAFINVLLASKGDVVGHREDVSQSALIHLVVVHGRAVSTTKARENNEAAVAHVRGWHVSDYGLEYSGM